MNFYTGYLEDEFSYTQLKDEVAELLGLSDITFEELKHETFGQNFIETYRNISTDKSQTDGYYLILQDYVYSLYRDFESYLRNLTGLNEGDFQLLLKQYNSKFITYKLPPGAYTLKDLSIVLSRGLNNEFETRRRMRANHNHDLSDSIIIDSDNVFLIINMRLGPQIMVLRVDRKSFFITILNFTPY